MIFKNNKKLANENAQDVKSIEERAQEIKQESKKNLITFIVCFALTIVLVFTVTRFYVIDKVNGESMNPTYSDGQWLILKKYGFDDITNGDVIVFKMPDKITYIKRVIAKPGDKIEIKGLKVLVNDTVLEEKYTAKHSKETFIGPLEIPEGYYFCMGDNRDNSHDSRAYGLVSKKKIIGIIQ